MQHQRADIYCRGGKVTNLLSTKDTSFKAAAACHPAFVDPKDAPNITIPIAILPSKDEDKSAVEGYAADLKVENLIKWYPEQIHGWMAARSDLEDEKVVKGFEDGYQTLLDWFGKHL
ncbi:hypothetical protein MRB53_038419 [Persea americana]|nr:hypothetical protein MRB53_038419 [Persea americana]